MNTNGTSETFDLNLTGIKKHVGSDGVYQSLTDSNGGRINSDFDDVVSLSDHGVMKYNYGAPQAIEPRLPSGFDVTPNRSEVCRSCKSYSKYC